MKAELYKNIDLIQIDIKSGVREYQFPKNVDWAKRKVDKIVLVAPTTNCLSPMDGITPVLKASQISDLYFDLYSENSSEIAQSLYYTNILYNNNHPARINSAISLQLSRLFFTSDPTEDGCLLIYVYWGSEQVDDYDMPSRSTTIDVSLAAGEKKSFREVIRTTLYADGKRVRGISVWNAEGSPTYLTLRDHQLSYIINSVYSGLMRPLVGSASASTTQTRPFLLNEQDIDFEYSFVRNATASPATQKITIYY